MVRTWQRSTQVFFPLEQQLDSKGPEEYWWELNSTPWKLNTEKWETLKEQLERLNLKPGRFRSQNRKAWLQRNGMCLYRWHTFTLLKVSTSRLITGANRRSESRTAVPKNESYSPEPWTACTSGVAAANPVEESQSTTGSELSCRARQKFCAQEIKPRKLKNLRLCDLLSSEHTRKNTDQEKNHQIVKIREAHSVLANTWPALVNSQEEPSPTGRETAQFLLTSTDCSVQGSHNLWSHPTWSKWLLTPSRKDPFYRNPAVQLESSAWPP